MDNGIAITGLLYAINAMKNILTFLLILSASSIFGQYIAGNQIDHSDVSKWIPELEIDFYGTYHFGVSENESTLILFSTGTRIIAQIKSGTWNSDGTEWLWRYKNLTNAAIHKNRYFNSDEYSGEFVYYNKNGELRECLAIYDSWSGITPTQDDYELGIKGGLINSIYSGKYTSASTIELNPEKLTKMSSSELKIMRNEIFARYGYKFIKGGKMDGYFSQQNWYKSQHSNVDKFLTELEKQNIKLIQFMEGKH